jgi:hypothetical protein
MSRAIRRTPCAAFRPAAMPGDRAMPPKPVADLGQVNDLVDHRGGDALVRTLPMNTRLRPPNIVRPDRHT